MKAIILAAGIGSRLKKITKKKPKALVNVNDKPILQHCIDALIKNSINDIVICTGYKSKKIKEFCKLTYSNVNFTFVENRDYNKTNNMYSLYLAFKYLNDNILLINGDVVFDSEIINGLLKKNQTSIAVDKDNYNAESMKVSLNNNGTIENISKGISKEKSYGCSIDVYKILNKDLQVIKKEIRKIIEKEKDINQWTEMVFDRLLSTNKIEAVPYLIHNKKWLEIDNYQDLINAEIKFNNKLRTLKRKKIFFVDRDGTLALENTAIDGANKFITKLKQKKKRFFIISNNSSKTPKDHVKILRRAGFDISSKNILISTEAAIEFLKSKRIKNIFWLANRNVSKYLKNNGFIYDEKTPSAILLTYDTEITYSKLRKLSDLVRLNIPFFATHPDLVYPTKNGGIPDIGSFIELIKITTGRLPDKIFGKPEDSFICPILKKYNLQSKDAVIIGDRLYTDILLGVNSKITSILVLSGEAKRESYEESKIRAQIVVNSVKDLLQYI